MSYTMKSISTGILQQQILLQPCSIHPFKLQVDGKLFNTTLNEDGDIISSNNRKSFIVTDEDILNKLKDIKTYLEKKI